MAKRKTIMKEFRIDEISAVDRPAQEGARAVIMKRAAPQADDSAENDDDEDLEDPEEEAGETPEEEKNEELADAKDKKTKKRDFSAEQRRTMASSGAALPDGSFPIANASDLHNALKAQGRSSHSSSTVRAHIRSRAKALGLEGELPDSFDKSMDNDNNQQENDMNETELKKALAALQERNEELQAELDVAKSYGQLTDAQKAHFHTLRDGDDSAFLAKSHSERETILAKAAEANPVVFTSEDGQAFRKNDDPRLIEMAKRSDAQAKLLKASAERDENATFAKRAGTELSKLPGDEATKVALLKAIDGIKDETIRKNAVALLKAGNEAISSAFMSKGSSQGVSGSATEQLEALAKNYSETNKVPMDKARVDVLSTPAGEALYAQTLVKA